MNPTNHDPTAAPRPAKLATFVMVQLVILAAGAGWGGTRFWQLQAARALPALRPTPLVIEPRYDQPVVASDEQLARVLARLVPRNQGPRTNVNHIDHALRFWTTAAKFDEPAVFSGVQLREVLTDHREFAKLFGPETPGLMVDGPAGVRVRVQEGPRSSSHVDHTMASLAEVGTPLDFPVTTPSRQTTYRALVEQALSDFSLNQIEYEWTAMTLALLMPGTSRFISREGQEISFDRLADRIMREALPQGVCFANHRIYALVLLVRVDERERILSPEMRARVNAYLARVTQLLVATQHADGYWDGNWPRVATAGEAAEQKTSGDPKIDRFLATGHALEWWAMAPEELHPPRHVLASAGQWLVREVEKLTPQQVDEYYTYLSHVGRSLAIWRKRQPSDVPVTPEAVR